MNELQPARFYMLVLSVFLLAMVAGTLYFLMGMGQSTYLLSDGVRVTTRFLDKPRYDMNLQGLIFSLSFLIAGALLLLMILLPDERRDAQRVSEAPPQPRRGDQGSGAAGAQPAAAQTAAAQATAQPSAPAGAPRAPEAPAEAAPAGQQSSPLSIEVGEGESAEVAPEAPPAVEEPAAPPAPAAAGVSVEEEVLQSAASTDDLPMVDFGDSRFAESGDEDVVYGDGRITEDAMWEFVQQYPDSAVKFLYRKTLDNKPLSPTEEDIYRNWEMRGMTRARVREIVLEVMRWQSLPDNFPHEIWRELRDQIYEISTSTR